MRRPRTKEQPKQIPQTTSPISEKALKDMKDKVRHSKSKNTKPINKSKE